VCNRGPEAARVHVLPTLWARNTWSWGYRHEGYETKPRIAATREGAIVAEHVSLGRLRLEMEPGPDGIRPELLFTENETNAARLYGVANATPYVKDAFHEHVVRGRNDVVNPELRGSKAAAHYRLEIPAAARSC
jgi:hypothetical protein